MEFNGTFFATIVSFIVFVYLMNKVLYEPIRKISNARKNFVEGNYNDAKENNEKTQELIDTRERKLVEAKDDARKKYNELVNSFKIQKSQIISEAQTETGAELDNAYKNLEAVSVDAKENLKNSINDLANDIVEKVLGYRSEINGIDNDKVNDILYNRKD